MAAQPVQLYSGVDSVRAADALRRAIQDRRDAWPYPHVYPPPASEDVFVIGTANTPNQGSTVAVVTYKVSPGKVFYLQAILFSFEGGVAFNAGDALFTVDRNSPVGVTNASYVPEHGLINVPVQLGVPRVEPYRLQRAREFAQLDIVRIKAKNVNLPVGAPNQFVCGLFGWDLPATDVKKR